MPILGNFPSGGGGGTGGPTLAAVTNIQTLAAAGKVYVKWTDPDDLVVAGYTLAAWGGTLLVRKAGSAPVSRRDGTVVLDSKTRNAYQSEYFCDSGLTDGVTYYYKFFPYTTQGAYTDSADNEFSKTPIPMAVGNVSSMSAVAAGNGKLALKWTDPSGTVVSNGVTLATWAKTTVVVKANGYATDPDDADAAYRLAVTTRNQYASNPLLVTGLQNGVTYYVSFFPASTDGAVNTSTANRITGMPNRLVIAMVPSQSGSLTYTGNAQSPSWSNYDSSKMTLGGVTSGTNAGSYNATFTPKNDYCWSDGSTVAKTVSWTIGKVAGSLSLSTTSVFLNDSDKSKAVTVTRAGNGAISAKTSDASVATASVSGNVVTIQSVNDKTGTATITISVAADTNHTAPGGKTVAVSAEFLPAVGTALNDCSWEDISKIAAAGLASTYWSVGATKTITINGTVGTLSLSNLSVDVFILGFDHNSSVEGSNSIHFQFGKNSSGTDIAFVDSNYGSPGSSDAFRMNTINTNSGGWSSSYMRETICTAFLNALPEDWRNAIVACTKYSDNTGGGNNTASYVTATQDKIWLLAEYEVRGARSYANSAEQNYQKQYDYYKNGNSKVKYNHDATGTACIWWLRSVSASSASSFCIVTAEGRASSAFAYWSRGFAPGFKVA